MARRAFQLHSSLARAVRSMAMKRPAAARQADAPTKRQVQGQAKPKEEKPSSSSTAMNRAAAAQRAPGQDVVQSGRKMKCQAEAKAVAKPRLEPPPARGHGIGSQEGAHHLCRGSGALRPATKMRPANALGAMAYSYRQLLQAARDVVSSAAPSSSSGPTTRRSSTEHASVCRMLSEHTCLFKLWVFRLPFIQRQPCRKPPAPHRASARWWRRCANVRRQTRRQLRKP